MFFGGATTNLFIPKPQPKGQQSVKLAALYDCFGCYFPLLAIPLPPKVTREAQRWEIFPFVTFLFDEVMTTMRSDVAICIHTLFCWKNINTKTKCREEPGLEQHFEDSFF